MNRTALDNWICQTEGLPGLTREALEALQLRRLNETLERLYQRGGQNYPRRLTSLEQLQTLPFTTPDMLTTAPGRYLLSSQSEVSRVISGRTSGTTGASKRVFYTEGDMDKTVGFFAAGISELLSPGEKCLICFPFSGPFGLGDLIARAVELLGAVPVRAGFGQSWGELTALLAAEQPETYIGFPVPLLTLARLYGKGLPLRRALVSGDACPEGVQHALETLLCGELYPHYGSRECGLGGAVTCPAKEGMHLRENHIIPEIVDEDGKVLPEGEFGELVITTMGMEAMPLIRYRTGDYTRLLPPCPCGGVTRRIDAVTRREGPISMAALDSALFIVPALADYAAAWDGCLRIEARVTGAVEEAVLRQRIRTLYQDISVEMTLHEATLTDKPLYPGKRYVR